MSRQQQVHVAGLVKIHGDRRALDLPGLTAGPGDRLGIVGENGAGKSTLLRILAGEERADAGTARIRGTAGHLPQEVRLPGAATVASLLGDALADLAELETRLGGLAGGIAGDPGGQALAAGCRSPPWTSRTTPGCW